MRVHVVLAANPDGTIAQVQCDFCGSRHRYHGGAGDAKPVAPPAFHRPAAPSSPSTPARTASASPFGAPLVAEVERSFAMSETQPDFEMILRRVIREETGLTAVAPAEKWRGGHLVLRPRTPGLQEKVWPIDSFFHKVVMLRNRLRVLEQNINSLDMPEDAKIKLQGYITGCYGSLTSFNVLFADADDRFHGTGGEES
jgi:hypothetical protein